MDHLSVENRFLRENKSLQQENGILRDSGPFLSKLMIACSRLLKSLAYLT
jgi:hypothetical protein